MAICAALWLGSATAWAADLKFGKAALATDDSGKLTAAGQGAALDELASEPGEEVWNLFLWAKVDKGAPGPLYVEFFDKLPDGKRYLAFRHEHRQYEGEPYVSMEIELEGNHGFNKGHTYTVQLTQADRKGKDIKLASAKLKLVYTEAAPDKDDDGGDDEGDDEGEGDDTADQDAIDTLSGADAGEGDGPPPVDPKGKKGCQIGGDLPVGAAGLFGLLVLGAVGRRRDASG